MAKPSTFRSRFRPRFDSKVQVFVAGKRMALPDRIVLPGHFVFADQISSDPRRIKLLFDQRNLEYADDDSKMEDFLKNTGKYEAQYLKEVFTDTLAGMRADVESKTKANPKSEEDYKKEFESKKKALEDKLSQDLADVEKKFKTA